MMTRRIYLATSWRNEHHARILAALIKQGHQVYDFKNPRPGQSGFSWKELDLDWEHWTPRKYLSHLLRHPIAARGYDNDINALNWCDTCVLLLPSGNSAHLEAGYASGQGKEVYILLQEEQFKPDLMYLMATGIYDQEEVMLRALEIPIQRARQSHMHRLHFEGQHVTRG